VLNNEKTSKPMVLKATLNYDSFINEYNALLSLQHQSVIRLLGTCSRINGHYCLLLEYCDESESLQDYLMKHENGLKEEEAMYIFEQLMEVLLFVHASNYCHHDLKNSNILFDERTKSVKIIDFGFSIPVSEGLMDYSFGTPFFASPEVLLHQPHDVKIADIWSLGVILYHMLTGNSPWDGVKSLSELVDRILNNNISFPSHVSAEACSLVSKILQIDPNNRISLTEINQLLKLYKEDQIQNQNIKMENGKLDANVKHDMILKMDPSFMKLDNSIKMENSIKKENAIMMEIIL